MLLEELKEAQMEEIMDWAKELGEILTPDALLPERLKDFPSAMETSERLKRICKWKAAYLKEKAQTIEDSVMDSIEQQEYVFKFNGGGMPVTKRKFTSKDKRERELRRRLAEHNEYKGLVADIQQWEMMFSDWVAHVNRLRREMRILETEYSASGSDIWQREYQQKFKH
jgi:hypothetical protein